MPPQDVLVNVPLIVTLKPKYEAEVTSETVRLVVVLQLMAHLLSDESAIDGRVDGTTS